MKHLRGTYGRPGLRQRLRGRLLPRPLYAGWPYARQLIWPLFSGGSAWGVFAVVALEVQRVGSFPGDYLIPAALHQHTSPILKQLALVLSAAGRPALMVALSAALAVGLWRRGGGREAAFCLTAVGGAVALNALIKPFFNRDRPVLWISLDPAATCSFPSSHAVATAALGVALGYVVVGCRWQWPVWLACGLFVLGVGWSRLYLGVHFPSDVLAGWAGSVGWVNGMRWLWAMRGGKLRSWDRQAPARLRARERAATFLCGRLPLPP